MQARQQKVTVKTVEIQDGDDFTMKTKITKELLDVRRPLMDSTIEIDAIRHKNWMEQAKNTARANSRDGIEHEESDVIWIVDKEKETKVQADKKGKGKVTPPSSDGSQDVIKDEDMNLASLRKKYPLIKATSTRLFLEKVKAL